MKKPRTETIEATLAVLGLTPDEWISLVAAANATWAAIATDVIQCCRDAGEKRISCTDVIEAAIDPNYLGMYGFRSKQMPPAIHKVINDHTKYDTLCLALKPHFSGETI